MKVRELSIPGAWEITPRQFPDERGVFLEWFKEPAFVDHIGHSLRLAQANASVSAAGVLRGIHFADVPPGQAKYVTCPVGAALDVAVDLRVGSPTFGSWDSVLLDDVHRRGIYLGEGMGHAFLSLQDGTTVVYLCSEGYAPEREHGVNPLDAELAVEWPQVDRAGEPLQIRLSDKDMAAPTLEDARTANLLPDASAVSEYIASLKS